MKLLAGWLIGACMIVLALPASAQSPSNTQSTPATSTNAADLRILPRLGVGYSTSGGGYDGFTRFEGFVPLYQTPGSSLLFLEGRFLLDNDANPGGNVLLGYRVYNPISNRIFGGYVAYDNRNTGKSVFSQIGFGLETLGDRWDVRANAYLPIGDTRQLIDQSSFDSGFQPNGLRFQNNFLLLSGSRLQQLIRDREAAMSGFDLEGGGRLLQFGNGGDLRGYAGLYYYDAKGSSSTVGVRGRLEARPLDNLTLGLGIQHDGLFGTNIIATIGLTFPSVRPKGATPQSVLARMGESPFRTGTIVVDHQREEQILSQQVIDTPLINQSTGQPYFFQHVIPGQTGGNGTFEQPFGQIEPALLATRSDGNDIVYVQSGNSILAGFTIPDRVQVLSTGPSQFLENTQLGQVQLPLSGSGSLPPVNGTITMGNNTVLSGFAITSGTGAGITFNEVSRVEIRDNAISNTGDSGILGNGVSEAILLRNQISSARNQGIYLQNVGTVTVTDNTVTNTSAGTTNIANPIVGDIVVPDPLEGDPITIPNPGSVIPLPSGQGIVIATVNGKTDISRNTISGTATQGIVLLDAAGETTIANNRISDTIGKDVTIELPILGDIPVPSGQGIVVGGVTSSALNITGNTVTNVRGQGLVLGDVTGTATLSNNTIQAALDQGIALIGTDATVTISGNQITDTATRSVIINNPLEEPETLTLATGQGIALANSNGKVDITNNIIERTAGGASDTPLPDSGQGIAVAGFSGELDLTIANNQIRSNFNDAILVGLLGTATANLTITGNTLENNGGSNPFIRGDGIGIGLEQDAVVNNLLIENNTIRGNGDEGIDIRLGLLDPLIQSEASLTGTIRNNSISNNAQNGIQLEARSNTQATVTLESNTISNNGDRGINLQTFAFFSNPQISADVRLNTLTGNDTPGVLVQTNQGFGNQTLCVNLNGNTSNTGYQLTGNAPTLQVVDLANVSTNNVGTVSQSGAIVNAASCP